LKFILLPVLLLVRPAWSRVTTNLDEPEAAQALQAEYLYYLAGHNLPSPKALSVFWGITNSIVDEFSVILPGNAPDSDRSGCTPTTGDFIQVLIADTGEIYPPLSNGNPASGNRVVATSRIGLGYSSTLCSSGKAAGIAPREFGQYYFVRVYNHASPSSAAFYGDTELVRITSDITTVFVDLVDLDQAKALTVRSPSSPSAANQVTRPMDGGDDDGDGLNNSWEGSYGSDPHAADTDTDGIGDYEEHLCQTKPTDADSALTFSGIQAQGSEVSVFWNSVSGLSYCVDAAGESGAFHSLAGVLADGEQSSMVVPPQHGEGFYRVRLVP